MCVNAQKGEDPSPEELKKIRLYADGIILLSGGWAEAAAAAGTLEKRQEEAVQTLSDKEQQSGEVSVRKFSEQQTDSMSLDAFIDELKRQLK